MQSGTVGQITKKMQEEILQAANSRVRGARIMEKKLKIYSINLPNTLKAVLLGYTLCALMNMQRGAVEAYLKFRTYQV